MSKRRKSKQEPAKAPAPPPAHEPVLMSEFPGLAEKLAETRREIAYLREVAFLGLPHTLCEVPCEQLRLAHWQALSAVNSPFAVGGRVNLEAITQFLWVLSIRRALLIAEGASAEDLAMAAAEFAGEQQFEEGEFPELLSEVNQYLDSVFMDMARGSDDPLSVACPSSCLSVYLFRELHKEFPRELAAEILALPIAAIFQFIRLADDDAHARAGLKRREFSRLDKVRNDIVFDRITAPAPCGSAGKPSRVDLSTRSTRGTSRDSRDSATRR
jgi:hypothetical protein